MKNKMYLGRILCGAAMLSLILGTEMNEEVYAQNVVVEEKVVATGEYAANPESEFARSMNEDGTIAITGYLGDKESTETIVVPSTISGAKVTSVVLGKCKAEEIILPEGITHIGITAFNECTNLKEITIPSTVESIGINAFNSCNSLESIVIPDSVTGMDSGVFGGCSNLKYIKISNNLETIPMDCFNGCSSLEEIVIPESVKCIDIRAFYNCSKLVNVTLPEGIETIKREAFEGTAIEEVYVPSGSVDGFEWIETLKKVTIDKNVTSVEGFGGCTNLTEVILEEGVDTIGDLAFAGCSSLKEIYLPESVTYIWNNAFDRCNNELVVYVYENSYAHEWVKTNANGFIFKVISTQEKESVRAFADRLYSLVLGRESDEAGIAAWSSLLLTKRSSGVDAGYGFVFSGECVDRNLSNDEFVNMLYLTFMNREADEGGRNAWVSQLDAGVEREKVLEGFIMSQEFNGICAEYGISVGAVDSVAAFEEALSHYCNQNSDVTAFVARCYTQALGREYDPVGLEGWCKAILTNENTPVVAAQSFIFSDEFVDKNLNNEEYIKVLYRTFFGREADPEGLAGWVGVLESGEEDRAKVLDGFANSGEFAEILASFGLN